MPTGKRILPERLGDECAFSATGTLQKMAGDSGEGIPLLTQLDKILAPADFRGCAVALRDSNASATYSRRPGGSCRIKRAAGCWSTSEPPLKVTAGDVNCDAHGSRVLKDPLKAVHIRRAPVLFRSAVADTDYVAQFGF